MIVSLTIKNFRSIKTEQTLNLNVEKLNDIHKDNLTFINDKLSVLKSVAIYGANASGKSNLIYGLSAIKALIMRSHSFLPDDPIDVYDPFRLSDDTKDYRTDIEIEFIIAGILYEYTVFFNKYNILHEKLTYYPKGKPAKLFTRYMVKGKQKFLPGGHLKGKKRIISCNNNVLYVSKAGYDQDSPEIIRDVFNFFYLQLDMIHRGIELKSNFITKKESREKLLLLMKCADIGISNIEVKDLDEDELNNLNKKKPQHREIYEKASRLSFEHNGIKNSDFNLKDESDGTITLFQIAPFIFKALECPNSGMLVIDEIDKTMHPLLARFIIRLFQDPDINLHGSQLIYTSQDMTLMDEEFLRRDQIWFVEKDTTGATELFCLDEFKEVRKNTPFAKWYLENRLGALPKLAYSRFKQEYLDLINSNSKELIDG